MGEGWSEKCYIWAYVVYGRPRIHILVVRGILYSKNNIRDLLNGWFVVGITNNKDLKNYRGMYQDSTEDYINIADIGWCGHRFDA